MRRPQLTIPLALAAALAGCSGSSTPTSCSEDDRKADILSVAQDYYLYLDLLPASGDPAADPKKYPTADAYLGALTANARAQGKDRNWSYLLTTEQYQSYYQQGRNAGFGLGLLIKGDLPNQRLFVSQTYPGSPAANAGFKRGDEIVAIGPDPQHLTPVANVANDGSLGALFQTSPSSFQVVPSPGGGQAVTRTASRSTYDLDPVPSHRVFGTTGYVALRTFITPAEPLLRAAFADFKAQAVQNVVVDLRYNGGGYINTAQIFSTLLAAGQKGMQMFNEQFNARHTSANQTFLFGNEESAGTFGRVAFITTKASASASELVPNVLDPYLPIAFVGDRTYGKPVGQAIFDLTGCDRQLFLISLKLVNSAGHGDYYQGLPDQSFSRGPLCPAADDLTHPQDSADEASTKAAIYFAEHGTCPPATSASRQAMQARALEVTGYPRVDRPTPAQRDIPGLF